MLPAKQRDLSGSDAGEEVDGGPENKTGTRGGRGEARVPEDKGESLGNEAGRSRGSRPIYKNRDHNN